MGICLEWPPPLQRIAHFRIFSFALRVGLLEAVEGAVDTAVCWYSWYVATLSEFHTSELATTILVAHKHFAGMLPLVIQTHWYLHWPAAGWYGKWTHSNSILFNLFFISVLEQLMIKQNSCWEKCQFHSEKEKNKKILHFWFYPIISKESTN